MLILNCGGTFNKRYNELDGMLEVPYDSFAIEDILKSVDIDYGMAGILFKDSLDITLDDRKTLASIIMQSKDDKFIIVHGTDTMNETAEFLNEIFDDRKIVLTGAMKPYEIDKVEASLNLGLAIGFVQACCNTGVYICMNGYINKCDEIVKNKKLGKFELVK